jgi:hypothetical protein
MAIVAEAQKQLTVYGLVEALETFHRDNRSSYDVDTRWLADFIAGEPLRIARQVRSSGLDPEMKAKVRAFRAAELEDEMEKKRRELADLERDLKKVKAA